MTNWYYVQGTERVGPVEESALHNVFNDGIIQEDSFVWTKGFANWEKLKEVDELKYFLEKPKSVLNQKESPEVQFNFNWKNIGANEEIFFIKTGQDRMTKSQKTMGPYSLKELSAAFFQKRINEQTYIYSPGMLYWERLGAIPTIQKLWNLGDQTGCLLETNSPNLMVIDRKPLPVISLIKEVVGNSIDIMCAQHMAEGDLLLTSLYKNEELKAKNIILKVVKVNQLTQTIECDISDLDFNNKKILNECAE
jgi:hypothetical protein